MSRFVRPQTTTLTLANGDQLIVRERLTAGEQRAYSARMYVQTGQGRQFDPFLAGVGAVLAYLLDWNLRDDQGQAVVIRDLSADDLQHVIDSLDVESFNEIRAAIDAHQQAMQEKKTPPDGGTPS